MSTSIARIGILSPVTEAGMKDWWNELREGLAELGYVEGRNIEFVWRFADGRFERLPALAIELTNLGVDVIMPATPPAIYAAKSASSEPSAASTTALILRSGWRAGTRSSRFT